MKKHVLPDPAGRTKAKVRPSPILMSANSRSAQPLLGPSRTGKSFSQSQRPVAALQNTCWSSGSHARSHGEPRYLFLSARIHKSEPPGSTSQLRGSAENIDHSSPAVGSIRVALNFGRQGKIETQGRKILGCRYTHRPGFWKKRGEGWGGEGDGAVPEVTLSSSYSSSRYLASSSASTRTSSK